MMETPGRAPEPPISGFLNSIGQVVITALEMLHTRLELAFLELQEGLEALVSLLVWSVIAVLATGMALLFGGLALIFVFWDTHRVLVTALIMCSFLLLAGIATWMALLKMQVQRSLFSITLAELAKDRSVLRAPP